MKIMTWNINGLRAIMKKMDLHKFSLDENIDIVCLQETKCNSFSDINFDGFNLYFSACQSKKGYAGTAILSKDNAITINVSNIDTDGRITAIEINDKIIVNVYVPNSQRNLDKLQDRLKWDQDFRIWLKSLPNNKEIIICGDFNISHTELDIAEPKKHHKHPGFTDEERNSFSLLLDEYVDIYRHLNPTSKEYTFWSYLGRNYERNIGYRCDMFLIKQNMTNKNIEVDIKKSVRFSDHCPVVLTLN